MVEQLTLGISLRDDATFANFFVANNKQVTIALQTAAKGRGEQFIYLWGKQGVGRSHLLQACCHAAGERGLSVVYLPLAELSDLKPDVLEGLESLAIVCIDDIHQIANRPSWEEAFFHFYNRMRAANKRLIVAGTVPPNDLGMALADLVSRLNWGVVFQVQELSDDEKIQALLMRARTRGLDLSYEVAYYLLSRSPRDMRSLFNALEVLDRASLQKQRKLTKQLVKEVLFG